MGSDKINIKETKDSSRRLLPLTALLFLLSLTIATGQPLPKSLIITGNGNVPTHKKEYPPWIHEFQNEQVAGILKGVTEIDITSDLNSLNDANLAHYELVISNSLFLTPSNEQLKALYSFVSGGKSYMTLHCGLISLLNWDKYEEFIGGIFIGGPSSVPGTFKVVTDNVVFWGYQYPFRKEDAHPVSVVSEDFITTDELYHFQPSARNFHVIARAENLPVMWWHPVGQGRVMSLTLGHDDAAKNNNGYQQLLRHGVQWLLGAPLIYGERPHTVSTRQLQYSDFIRLQSSVEKDVTYQLINNDRPDVAVVSVQPGGKVALNLTGKGGIATFTVSAQTASDLSAMRSFELNVVPDGIGNIAAYSGNTASATSYENMSTTFAAGNVIDNDTTTRWSSAPVESVSFSVDLQKTYRVKKIILKWEASYATEYNIALSTDGKNWTSVKTETSGDGETDVIDIAATTARFVRLEGTRRADNKWGYSLYEIAVFEK